MIRTLAVLLAIHDLLLQKATSLCQIKSTNVHNNFLHSIGKRKSTLLQWLRPFEIGHMFGTHENSNVCVSASSTSDIDTRPESEKVDSIIGSLRKLCGSGSDIRGRFVDHDDSIHSLVAAIQGSESVSKQPALTPFAAYCIGYSYANAIAESLVNSSQGVICIGVDPRTHGVRLAEAFACGVRAYLSHDSRNRCSITVVFTGAATTPACASFVRSKQCDGAVVRLMYVTATLSEPKDEHISQYWEQC
jgi:hypothetical protein